MTPERQSALFDRIQTLQQIDIDHVIERGKDYLLERLKDCRRRQDEIGQIAVEIKRALFTAKIARRNARAAAKLSNKPGDEAIWLDTEDTHDQLKALEECCNVARGTIRLADSDIRLAATLLGVQVYLGQPGTPPESDGKVKPVEPAAVDEDNVAAVFEPAPEPDLDSLFAPPRAGDRASTRPPAATVDVAEDELVDLASLIES